MLFQLGVEVGIGKAVLRPMLENYDVSGFGAELWMPFATPRIDRERLSILCVYLGGIYVLPTLEISVARPMMRNDENLDPRRSYGRYQLSHVRIKADRICGRLGGGVQLAAFAHEVVIGIDDQERRTVRFI